MAGAASKRIDNLPFRTFIIICNGGLTAGRILNKITRSFTAYHAVKLRLYRA